MFDLQGLECSFVHNRIIGAVGGLISSGGNPLAAASGFARGGGSGGGTSLMHLGLTDERRREITRAMSAATARGDTGEASAFLRELGTQGALGPARSFTVPNIPVIGCIPPFFENDRGKCELDIVPGKGGGGRGRDRDSDAPRSSRTGRRRARAMADPGEAVMGRYGAGMEPTSRRIRHSSCLPGMVLGDDDICYNKGQVPNARRMWPRGRRPLLTGGEMKAISTAARAAKRVQATTKKLQALGMIKKPAARRARGGGGGGRKRLGSGSGITVIDTE